MYKGSEYAVKHASTYSAQHMRGDLSPALEPAFSKPAGSTFNSTMEMLLTQSTVAEGLWHKFCKYYCGSPMQKRSADGGMRILTCVVNSHHEVTHVCCCDSEKQT